ncbi:MAG: acetylglutamate kinase [Bacteroidales bacterium]
MKKEKLTIIKVGGKIVEQEKSLNQLLKDFAEIPGLKMLVHGGGRSATALATRMGVETQMIDGRRVTDKEMLEIVTMVYGGLVNKKIVAGLQAIGIDALGLTGADLNAIRSERRPANPIDYGFVGDVKEVNAEMLASILSMQIVPVMAPLTHDGEGQMLNTNADTIAGETAKGLADKFDVTLIYCFEKKGVLRDENDDLSVIPSINKNDFAELVSTKIVSGGMIPKLTNAFEAIDKGVKEVIITQANDIQGLEGTRIH